jgi:hypothetical protein
MSILGLIILIVFLAWLFRSGPTSPYFYPGGGLGLILLLLLLFWMFGGLGDDCGGYGGHWVGHHSWRW